MGASRMLVKTLVVKLYLVLSNGTVLFVNNIVDLGVRNDALLYPLLPITYVSNQTATVVVLYVAWQRSSNLSAIPFRVECIVMTATELCLLEVMLIGKGDQTRSSCQKLLMTWFCPQSRTLALDVYRLHASIIGGRGLSARGGTGPESCWAG